MPSGACQATRPEAYVGYVPGMDGQGDMRRKSQTVYIIVLFCKDYMHINVAPLPGLPSPEKSSVAQERASVDPVQLEPCPVSTSCSGPVGARLGRGIHFEAKGATELT